MCTSQVPLWSSPFEQGSRQTPLRADLGRSRLRNRLLPAFTAVPSRLRLRYLSYFCWCLSEYPDEKPPFESFEKVFLLSSVACGCDRGPLEQSGFVGRYTTHGNTEQNLDPSWETVWSTSESQIRFDDAVLSLPSRGSNGFSDRYVRMARYLHLATGDPLELTKFGDTLAQLYGDAINSFNIDELIDISTNQSIHPSILEQNAGNMCACAMSKAEKQQFAKIFFGLYSAGVTGQSLRIFSDTELNDLDPITFYSENLDSLLNRYREANKRSISVAELFTMEQAESKTGISNQLAGDFGQGEHVLNPLSMHLLLSLTARHNGGTDPSFEGLKRTRKMWHLYNLGRYFVEIHERLLETVVGAVLAFPGRTAAELCQLLVESEGFSEGLASVPDEVSIAPDAGSQRSTSLEVLRQGIDYGTWSVVNEQISCSYVLSDQELATQSWDELRRDTATQPTEISDFQLDGASIWALRKLLNQEAQLARSLAAEPKMESEVLQHGGRAVAHALQAFMQFQSRFKGCYEDPSAEKLKHWYFTVVDSPPEPDQHEPKTGLSPRLLWDFPFDTSREVQSIGAHYLQKYVIARYFDVLYYKYRESGTARTFLTREPNGKLYHESSFKSQSPNENIFKQVCDTFAELGLLQSNDYRDLVVTQAGKKHLTAYSLPQ